jgi:glutamate-1-semialdehyde 2,1-aminomutase
MTLFFTDRIVTDFASAKTSDTKGYAKFFTAMLDAGIYLAPSQFEAAFLSTAHTDADIEKTIKAAYAAVRKM